MQKSSSYRNDSVSLGLAILVYVAARLVMPDFGPKMQTPHDFTPVAVVPLAPSEATVYDTGKLAGRKAADLYSVYLGYSGTQIPRRLSVDWTKQLASLWDRKMQRRDSNAVAAQTGQALVSEYGAKDPEKISLESYQAIAGKQSETICAELDWEKVRSTYRLNGREGALLKRIACNMGGRTLLAYSMTELLPSSDGQLNREYLDFVLRHGGRRFIESLPAMHDGITSFGPYQFTSNALYDTPKGRRGASKVNQALPSRLQIPGSTILLRDADHFRAAYLFGISNLADAIRKLDARQIAVFEKVGGAKGVDVAQFLATAHNKPAVARNSLKKWLAAGGTGEYRQYLPPISRLYATKTVNNYQALSPTKG